MPTRSSTPSSSDRARTQTIIEFSLVYAVMLASMYVAVFHFDWIQQSPFIFDAYLFGCGMPPPSAALKNASAAPPSWRSQLAAFVYPSPVISESSAAALSPTANMWLVGIIFSSFFAYWTVSAVALYKDATLPTAKWLALRHDYPKYAVKAPTGVDWHKYLLAVRLASLSSLVSYLVLPFFFAIARRFRWENVCSAEHAAEPVQLLALRLIVCYYLTDAIFFTMHKIAHLPLLYPMVHKLHHTFVQSYAVDAAAANPLEHLLINLVTVHLAPILSGLPAPLWCAWSCVAAANTTLSHSGYGKVFFVGAYSNAHDAHHAMQQCEFGTDLFCDTLARTTKADYLRAIAKKRKAEQ